MRGPLVDERVGHMSSLVCSRFFKECQSFPHTNPVSSRIDLNPPKEGENGEQQEGENAEHAEETVADGTATAAGDAAPGRHGHRLTNYLNVRRMHNASVEERLAALRRVREANQDQAAEEASRPSRNRLTARLRERFRIRTRAHGVESTTPGQSGTSTPTVPAPAHTAPESSA